MIPATGTTSKIVHPPEDLSLEEIRARKPQYQKKISLATQQLLQQKHQEKQQQHAAAAVAAANAAVQQQHVQQMQAAAAQHQAQQAAAFKAFSSAAAVSGTNTIVTSGPGKDSRLMSPHEVSPEPQLYFTNTNTPLNVRTLIYTLAYSFSYPFISSITIIWLES